MIRVPGRKFVRRSLRPLVRTLFPGAVVLGYHRVAGATWDPLGLAVRPEHFAQQLDVLAGHRQIVTLRELTARHAAGERLDRFAVLTFDDGYRDFAEAVVPALEARQLPATVFVATGFTGGSFWWAELVALLRSGDQGRSTLEISAPAGAGSWRYRGLERSENRTAAVQDLCRRLTCRSEPEIRAVLDQLRHWSAGPGAVPAEGVPMDRDDLCVLAGHPLVDIGAHTVSHGCLGQLEPEVQRLEIARSKADLESITGKQVKAFSYPNGSYSAATPGIVRSLGFSCACKSLDGVFTRRGDPFLVPRVWVSDLGGPAFRSWLGNWIAGLRQRSA